MNIAIFGAAFAIGPAAALELSARGHRVRAVSRNPAALAAAYPGAEPHGPLGAIAKTSYDDGIAATVAARFPNAVAA